MSGRLSAEHFHGREEDGQEGESGQRGGGGGNGGAGGRREAAEEQGKDVFCCCCVCVCVSLSYLDKRDAELEWKSIMYRASYAETPSTCV